MAIEARKLQMLRKKVLKLLAKKLLLKKNHKKILKKLLQREPDFLEGTKGIDGDIGARQGDLLDV